MAEISTNNEHQSPPESDYRDYQAFLTNYRPTGAHHHQSPKSYSKFLEEHRTNRFAPVSAPQMQPSNGGNHQNSSRIVISNGINSHQRHQDSSLETSLINGSINNKKLMISGVDATAKRTNPISHQDQNDGMLRGDSVKNGSLDRNDPAVRKLVNGALRNMYGAYHGKANQYVANLPQNLVRKNGAIQTIIDTMTSTGDLGKLNGRVNPNVEDEKLN